MTWEDKLKIYDELISHCPGLKRKGKTAPSTTANGYMFSHLNKEGQIGIRLPKEKAEEFVSKYGGDEFRSYGAVMREYVHVPDALLDDLEEVAKYLAEGHRYVMSLKPK